MFDKDDSVDIIHLDFSKAFDWTPYDTLVKKLALNGINKAPIKLVHDTSQNIVAKAEISAREAASCSVPVNKFSV